MPRLEGPYRVGPAEIEGSMHYANLQVYVPTANKILSGEGVPSPAIGKNGEQYIDVLTGTIYGPKKAGQWGGGTNLWTPFSLDQVAETFYQTVAADVWIINHNLNFVPNVTVVDLNGSIIEGDYKFYNDKIEAVFSEPIVGAAYLS